MNIKPWPKSGAVLWVGHLMPTTEESAIFKFGCEVLLENSPRSLSLLRANTHPDFCKIYLEGDSQSISIDRIRALIEWFHSRPQIAERRVAFISPAEALNLYAANALLKTLEELPVYGLCILAATQIERLPATLVSRCHVLRDRGVACHLEQGDTLLHQQVIRDLEALEQATAEPVAVAATWLKSDLNQMLHWVVVVLHDRFQQAAKAHCLDQWRALFTFLDAVYEAKRVVQNRERRLNTQLLIEALLIQYTNSYSV